MQKDLYVRITYRNANLDPVNTQMYELKDYTDMMRNDLLKVISDIEDAFYVATGNRYKDEWPDDVWSSFTRIKHKLLDKAGDIGRLPDNLIAGDSPCL